jgi:hypothetical protein
MCRPTVNFCLRKNKYFSENSDRHELRRFIVLRMIYDSFTRLEDRSRLKEHTN